MQVKGLDASTISFTVKSPVVTLGGGRGKEAYGPGIRREGQPEMVLRIGLSLRLSCGHYHPFLFFLLFPCFHFVALFVI